MTDEIKATPLESLAMQLYDAYGRKREWKAWNGTPMPLWNDCGDGVQSGWLAVAECAINLLDPDYLLDQSKVGWRYAFDDRSMTEIKFAQEYLDKFNHGTTGHNALVIIAKLAKLLDANGAQALPYA